MRRFLNSIFILLLAGSLAAAQTTPADASVLAKPAEKLGTHASAELPSEATVDSFLHQQFGYQADLTWKISSINLPPSKDWRKSLSFLPARKASS